MSEQPLTPIDVPNGTSRFPGFEAWFKSLAASVAVQGMEILSRSFAAVRAVEKKLPTEVRGTYAAVVTDQAGRISEATLLNGRKYFPSMTVDEATVARLTATAMSQAGQLLESQPGEYSRITVDANGRIAEDALGLDGRVPAWVLEAWMERMGPVLRGLAGVDPYPRIAGFGDSMTQGVGGSGTTWVNVASNVLGIDSFNGGISGQTSTEIAIRQGGLPVLATMSGNAIPASGSVAITSITPTAIFGLSARSFLGSFAGISGVLAKDANQAWSFTRSTAGSSVVCPPGTRFISETSNPYRAWISVFWSGRNNVDKAIVERDTAAMVAHLSPLRPRYLVLSICNAQSEPSGSIGYNNVMAINAALATSYGASYVDVRRYLIDYGLQAVGVSPTAADTTAISQDRIPPSLMVDDLHFNANGYTAVGRYIAAVITERGWTK